MPKNHMSHYIQPHGRHKGRPLEWLIFAALSYALRIRRQLPGDRALQEAFDAIEEHLVPDRVVLSCDFCGTNQAAFTVVPSTWNAYLWKKSRFWCGDCYRPYGWDRKSRFELSLAGAERLVRAGARRADTKGFGRLLGEAYGAFGPGVGNLTEARALEFFHAEDVYDEGEDLLDEDVLIPSDADIKAMQELHPDAEDEEIFRLAEATALIRTIAAHGDDEDD